MVAKDTSPPLPQLNKELTIIVGGYGSGKSEVAVNLSRLMVLQSPEQVALADLDIVNPYFRSREAAERLTEIGVVPIIPPGEQRHADLPIIMPEIKGSIDRHEGRVILDVGGDDVGARVLSSLSDALADSDYDMLLVLNAYRPFTADLEGSRKMMEAIEASSRLRFTGIIANTHMMEHTSVEDVSKGLELAKQVSKDKNIPIVFVSAIKEVAAKLDTKTVKVPLLPLDRHLLRPWERPAG